MKEIIAIYKREQELLARYRKAKEAGDEAGMQDAKIPVYIETLKKLGFKNFTFSSTWSSAVETAWIFTQNGCSLKGLIEINSPYKDFMGEGYEKAHGYLFSID